MKPLIAVALTTLVALTACSGSSGDRAAPERVRTTAALRTFDSCAQLLSELRDAARERARAHLEFTDYNASVLTGPVIPPASSGPTVTAGTPFSRTNNQEVGVDEGDIVKTDGQHIFVLNGDRLEILVIPTPGDLRHEATHPIEGSPRQLLLGDDRAVVFSVVTPNGAATHPLKAVARQFPAALGGGFRSQHWTKITVIDIADRTAPQVTHELYTEADYRTSRMFGTAVRVVTHAWMYLPDLRTWPDLPTNYYSLGTAEQEQVEAEAIAEALAHNEAVLANTTLSDFVPELYERLPNGQLLQHDLTLSCASFMTADDARSESVTSILTLSLTPGDPLVDTDHLVTNQATVYASTDTLLIAEDAHGPWWHWGIGQGFDPATNIHRFDIRDPLATHYTGSGRVDGELSSPFSLDEHEDTIRVATTTGLRTLEPEDAETHVWVLAGINALDIVGEVHGIGIGETLWSSRFIDEKGYLVTFRAIDPLWTIDLSNPTAPAVVGELEVPGVSTYIHPLTSAGRLLTVGLSGAGTPSISLFDVRNFAAPTLEARLDLSVPSQGAGWRGVWSEAVWDHKAFQYWEPAGILAVPVDTSRHNSITKQYENVSRLELIAVDPNGSLSPHASIDHSEYFNSEPGRAFMHNSIRRSIFVGDYVYAISDRAVTVHDVDTANLRTVVQLPGP